MDPYKVCNIFQNGVLLRTVLDNVTGDLSDTRTRYLGVRPVKLFRITMQGSEAVSVLFINVYLLETALLIFIISLLKILNKTIKQSCILFSSVEFKKENILENMI